jgi:transposase-like protein
MPDPANEKFPCPFCKGPTELAKEQPPQLNDGLVRTDYVCWECGRKFTKATKPPS